LAGRQFSVICLICSHATQEILHTDNWRPDGSGDEAPHWLAGLGEEVVQTLSYAWADTMSRSEPQSRFRRPLRGGGACRGTPARAGDISSRPGSDASSSRSRSRGIETYRISPMHAGGPLVIIAMRLENSTVSPMS
jgi:hypothetical protein